MKTNNYGAKLWDARFGADGEEQSPLVIQTNDGGCLLGGSTYTGMSGDKSHESQGWLDYWVLKISPVTSVNEIQYAAKLMVYPNPVAGEFRLCLSVPSSENGKAIVELINPYGQKVYVKEISISDGLLASEIQFPEDAADAVYLLMITLIEKRYATRLTRGK